MNTKEALMATLQMFLLLAFVIAYVWLVVEIIAFSKIIGIMFFFVSLFLTLFVVFRFIFPK